MAWPCSRILGIYFVILLEACHELHSESFPITDTSNTTGPLAPQPAPAVEPFLALGPLKADNLPCH